MKWLSVNLDIWHQTGKFFEKYDVQRGTHEVLTDRYKNQEGFGWTNAIFHVLVADLRTEASASRSRTSLDFAELRRAEYDTLNREILDNSTKIYQVLNFCIAATAGLLAVAINFDINKRPIFNESAIPFLFLLSVQASLFLVGHSPKLKGKAGARSGTNDELPTKLLGERVNEGKSHRFLTFPIEAGRQANPLIDNCQLDKTASSLR